MTFTKSIRIENIPTDSWHNMTEKRPLHAYMKKELGVITVALTSMRTKKMHLLNSLGNLYECF